MSEKKEEDCLSEQASSQAESFDANKSGNSETYDMKDFCPGIRIEAKDFDGKWYPAKVLDVDWTENEILVHFENWNTKFDEWIPMDSSRLRPLQKPIIQQKEHIKFSKGEEVMAMWSPYQKYPATIQAVLANDRYDVLFYDGFLKRLKGHKISKLEGETVKSEVRNFADIGTKEERRERKRKINVAELFHINKRSKKKGLVHSKAQDIKTYPVSKSRNKGTLLKKVHSSIENTERIGNVDSNEIKEKDDKLLTSVSSLVSKSLVDTIPAAFEVKYINGQTEMWSKQLYQRSEGRTAGKLDIVILNPQGRKFRSRNEIMKYCDENGIIYSHEAFDFSAKGRPKSKSNVQPPSIKLDSSVEDKDKSIFKKNNRRSQLDVPVAPQTVQISNQTEILPPVSDSENKVFIGDIEVVIENGKFICPVKVCGKYFRRENLLHMHMKHYHPEFSKYLDYTPSVTDLAYARTVGGLDVADVTSPISRKSTDKPEKLITKGDNLRKTTELSADHSKDNKKLKLDIKVENKSHQTKGLEDLSLTPATPSENSEEMHRIKSSNLPSKSAPHENESSVQSGTVDDQENKSSDPVASESRNAVLSHSILKSLRHHRLHSRKKTSRFQGSFAEHMRKRRLISQDHSKSQNRVGRQQQPHLRQQLQQVLPTQTTINSQSLIEDTNSNTGQAHAYARYPKPHSITNEMPGKNHLLTSSKTLSPVSEKMNRKRDEGFENDDIGDISNSLETAETISKLDGLSRELSENNKGQLVKRPKPMDECSRRSFLAGLINARKRKAKTASYRMRKRRRKARDLRSSFDWELKRCDSGPSQNTENLNEITEIEGNGGDGADTSKGSESSLADLGHRQEKLTSQEMIDTMSIPKKSIKIRLKCIGVDKLNLGGESDVWRSEYTESESFDSNGSDEFISSEDKLGVTEDSYNGKTKDILEVKASNERNLANNVDVKTGIEGSVKGVENETPKRFESEKNAKYEVNPADLPKSCVLLENVCRKEIYGKYINMSRRGNDENVGGCGFNNADAGVASPARKRNRKIKRGNKFNRGRSRGRRLNPRKKVRFENTVMEKWINVDESDEFTHETNSKSREARREDRKKRPTKAQLVDNIIDKEASQVKRLDDSSRHDYSHPPNNSGLDQAEGVEDSKSALVIENDKVEKLRRNEIINCLCGITEEDGLMIQCDLCLCWQHGHCAGIFRESDVPDKYICAICKNPYRARQSMKYLHDQEWLKEGALPSLSFRSKREDIINQRRTILKRSHDLSGSIALLAQVIHSLRLKVNIAEKKDHPKLWLWAKKWTEKKPNRLKDDLEIKGEKTEEQSLDLNGIKKEESATEDDKHLPKAPEPEAPIDSAECRLNLLDHLIHYQTLIDARLSCIESLVAELESMQDDAVSDETPDRYPRTKATVQMILRDLNTMKKIATI